MRNSILCFTLFVFGIAFAVPVLAQEREPGDACTATGAFTRSGGAEIPGGHFMVCDGSNWVSFIDYADAGRTLFQVDYDSGAWCRSSLISPI